MPKLGLVINNKELMKEWDWEKNEALGLDPNKLTCGSSKKAWWKCKECRNEWATKISHKNKGTKCKNCKNLALSIPLKGKSLRDLYPNIAQEWDYEKNDVPPNIVYPHSNKKRYWICIKGHKWQDSPAHRVERQNGCPFCSNHQVLPGYNDLVTTHPNLMAEWDWEKNDALNIKPTQLTYGSKQSANWICKRGHHWRAGVYSRTTNNRGCPYCSRELRMSYPEKIISYYVSKNFSDLQENYRDNFLGKYELDMYIPSIKTAIEYDGARWHQNITNDLLKDNLCNKLNIKIIRIREYGCPEYESDSLKLYVHSKKINELQKILEKIMISLSKLTNKSIKLDINLEKDSVHILQNILSQVKDKSIANTTAINYWDWEKNEGIDPNFISRYSNRKFWWMCEKKHEWYTSAAHISNGRRCPRCAHIKRYANKNH